MGKEQLLYEIQRKTAQLNASRNDLRTEENKLSALDEFTAASRPYINAFEDSMQRRKAKLLTVAGLEDRALSAKRYREQMQEALSGSDYRHAVSSIEGMQSAVSGQRQTVIRNINALENRIRTLQRQIDELRYRYNTYPEENNGE